jgi:predicted transposase YbfD/YdcC
VPEKTNEIAAIPGLLDRLAETNQLKGALVTIDAIGFRVKAASKREPIRPRPKLTGLYPTAAIRVSSASLPWGRS